MDKIIQKVYSKHQLCHLHKITTLYYILINVEEIPQPALLHIRATLQLKAYTESI